jgi:hypothetical protein
MLSKKTIKLILEELKDNSQSSCDVAEDGGSIHQR